MQLTVSMDAGPVYVQAHLPVAGTESKQALADHLLNLGKELLLTALSKIIDGSLQPNRQDGDRATYDTRLDKSSGDLDWQKPASLLEREVRAFSGWPRSRTNLGGTEIIVTAAHCESGVGEPGYIWQEANKLGIFTSDGVLVIDRLVPAGKNEMDGAAFINGYTI